ncbi:MAG: M20/M25/M40 family metallo-hydrolase [Deltaproteobacteria bacterium]|nr:M20/M25/M40 family metallo-hydrolase [Deltaproteobacteria bacterium]
MNRMMRLAGFCFWGLTVASSALAAPVQILRGAASKYAVNPDNILYVDGDITIVKAMDANFTDFSDLYVVNMSHRIAWPDNVDEYGEVVHFEPSRFALMQLHDNKVEELAGRLHGEGLACGTLLKLTGRSIFPTKAATPVPLIDIATTDARIDELTRSVKDGRIRSDIEGLANIPTRYHGAPSGKGVADYLLQQYRTLQGARSDVSVATYDHGRKTNQRSLVVRVQGKSRPNEVIVLGSHLDSVNWQDGTSKRSPGADDNASGTATNLEIFRVLMEHHVQLERTLEIHAYAAEEIGLVGSQDIASAYRSKGVPVVAMMQIDMDLWRDDSEPAKIWLVSNQTNDGFNNGLGQLVDHYVGLPWAKRPLSGGSSDHASWHREGYAAAFPFENPSNHNPHIHTADDTIDTSGDFDLATGFAKLGLAYVAHYGGMTQP